MTVTHKLTSVSRVSLCIPGVDSILSAYYWWKGITVTYAPTRPENKKTSGEGKKRRRMHSGSGPLMVAHINGLARHCHEEDLRIIDEFGVWNKLKQHQKNALQKCRNENYVTKEPGWSIWWSEEKRCYLYQPSMNPELMQIVVLHIHITYIQPLGVTVGVSRLITRSLLAGLQRISGKSSKDFLFVHQPRQNRQIC